MPDVEPVLIQQLHELALAPRLTIEPLAENLARLRLSSRASRLLDLEVSPYLYGDLLIDTGFAHVSDLLAAHLEHVPISAICCTHHHEDHTGSCARLAREHRCPVYLHHPEAGREEGLADLPIYRHVWWGAPEAYDAQQPPDEIRGSHSVLRVIPTPGHSATHIALFEERTGLLFSGDLFISSGASAVMTHENPYQLVSSLRRLAALSPARMLTGHGLTIDQPKQALETKASLIEEATAEATRLHDLGRSTERISQQIFPARSLRYLLMDWLTAGEFTRSNFVRAALRWRDQS